MGLIFKRKFLRVHELLQRWQCTEADLRNEVIEGELPPTIFVREPEKIVDREGKAVFSADEHYIRLNEDVLLSSEHGNVGYLVLRAPIREGLDTCSFSLFSKYQDQWDGLVCLPERMFPLDIYWHEMVFDLPSVARFERERTQGANPAKGMEKPLSTRERDTLLTVIAALCTDAGYDYAKHSKTAGLIRGMALSMGVQIGETTIENHLKKIPHALETRME